MFGEDSDDEMEECITPETSISDSGLTRAQVLGGATLDDATISRC